MQDTPSEIERFMLLLRTGSTDGAAASATGAWCRALIDELGRRGLDAAVAIVASAHGPLSGDGGIEDVATMPVLEVRIGAPGDTPAADTASASSVAVDGAGEPASLAPILEWLEARGWAHRVPPGRVDGYSAHERATVEARLRDLGYL